MNIVNFLFFFVLICSETAEAAYYKKYLYPPQDKNKYSTIVAECFNTYLQRTTAKIAKKMNVDLKGCKVVLAQDRNTCRMSYNPLMIFIGKNMLIHTALSRGSIAHELGHVKNGIRMHEIIPVLTIGAIIGSQVASSLINFLGLSNKEQCNINQNWLVYGIDWMGLIYGMGIASNLYDKFDEYRTDTEAIRFLQREQDCGALNAQARDFYNSPTSLERLLGASYLTEIIDTFVTASTFGKFTYFGGHPSNLSRAARFEKAADEIKNTPIVIASIRSNPEIK